MIRKDKSQKIVLTMVIRLKLPLYSLFRQHCSPAVPLHAFPFLAVFVLSRRHW
jgi:hypothetical protein